ncbi:MAG: OpgC domain-containing protein, partial [Fluviicola sp.]|nr:OpgC domain-containing protein [Fluviicola sp.]
GQFSDFSILRYAGYTLMGGMIGSIIRTFEHKTREWWFGATFITVGILISSFIQAGLHQIDNLTENWGWVTEGRWEMNATHFIRLGQVITVLGLLMLVDAYFNVKAKLFLKVGQNTLPIYIVHVIILYGGIFGFGLKPLAFDENLGPWQAILISMSAMIFFVIMVKYIEPLERIYFKVKNILFFRKEKA